MHARSTPNSYSPIEQPTRGPGKASFTPLACKRLPSAAHIPFGGVMPLCSRYWDFMSPIRRDKQSRYRVHKAKCRHRRVMNEEQRITVCKTSLNQIYAMLRASPQDWRNYINLARTIITHLDATTFMQQGNRTQEQVWMIAGLQRLAFAEPDSGGVNDIAAWCSRQWLVIYQREPTNLAALRGIGQVWLARAQPVLARIHRADGSSSSSAGSARSQRSIPGTRDEDRSPTQTADAERRAGTADYVEARGYLQPATEYLERAVAVATAQRALSGDLLATTAEAYMSLGNASGPRVNQGHFRRAIQLLRAATSIQGYTLSRYLQQYLDDYGRLVE